MKNQNVKSQAKDWNTPIECARPRVGKIARLPGPMRHELNLRIEEGEEGESLLDWLNELPETRTIIEEEFGGKPVSKQNLSDWKRGGYAEWLLRRQLTEHASEISEQAFHLREDNGLFLADDLLTVFIARYASLIARWDGEASEAFSDKVRLFSRIRRDLLRLQEGANIAAANSREEDQRDAEEKQNLDLESKQYALAPLRAMMRRSTLEKQMGKFGGQYADALDAIDLANHPLNDLFRTFLKRNVINWF